MLGLALEIHKQIVIFELRSLFVVKEYIYPFRLGNFTIFVNVKKLEEGVVFTFC